MIKWSAGETGLYLLSWSFDTDHVPEATVCWMLHRFPIIFFFLAGGGNEKENPVQVKPGNNSESESLNLSLPHPQTEKPAIHVWHTCPTAAPEAGCPPMPQPSPALQATPFVSGLLLLLPCACQRSPPYAGAVLSHFGPGRGWSGMTATPVPSQGPVGSAPHGVWVGCPVRGSRGRSSTAERHPRRTPCLRAALARKTACSILGILTKQRECPPWFCLDIFCGAYFQGWLWLLTLPQMALTVALAGCHSLPVSSLTFSSLYNVGNPAHCF